MAREDYPTANPFVPEERDLESMAEAARHCRGCPLWQGATHVVFGEGPEDAEIVLVGEQPGRREDETGRPFVGPAGQALDRALEEVGVDRNQIYITNAVKHFKSKRSNGTRQGVTPRVAEINACNPWLQAELEQIDPRIVVAMGTVAARSLAGRALSIGETREQWLHTQWGQELIVTFHPSASIRAMSNERREQIFEAIVYDLQRAKIGGAGEELRR